MAVRLPKAVGVNLTLMRHFWPAPNVAGLIGQFPPQAKSEGPVPLLIVMLLMVTATVWVFLKVAVFVVLDTPTATLPKDNVEGLRVV